jgi:uncharacterized membrane protein (DUF106 family)
MLFIALIIAFALFFYFQKKTSDRNMERFQKSRDKYEQLLEQLRKSKDDEEVNKESTGDK